MITRAERLQLFAVMAVLVVLHFYVRPRLWDARMTPDFLLLALLLYAMRSRPGHGALAGFVVGLIVDAVTPARFGAAMLAHTIVGYLAAWGRAVFFADNLLVNVLFVALGVWVRDLLLVLASGMLDGMLVQLAVYAPLQALATGVAAFVVLFAFREWFAIRFDV
ncbi:MAG: rod shape-determining protein MreD [Gemmatimonadota bacterium]|nr:rod shape-determining protein MreD [Gemmatimonadota bacterium]